MRTFAIIFHFALMLFITISIWHPEIKRLLDYLKREIKRLENGI